MEPPRKAAKIVREDHPGSRRVAERETRRAENAKVLFPGCRSITEYEKLNVIDEGTFGCVFRYRDRRNGEVVALKKVKMDGNHGKHGFPITSMREIGILMKHRHPNLVDVKEVVVGKSLRSVYMAMEFIEHDLRTLMQDMNGPFLGAEVKCLMQQLLQGVAFLHNNWVLHRDLKTANLLMSNKGILKIADFGQAREFGSPLHRLSPMVTTMWYSAPEMLLGSKEYTVAVDMWAVGCIFAELVTRTALFPGQGQINQLTRIFSMLGTPSEETWPGLGELPAMKKFTFKPFNENKLRQNVTTLTNAGFDLLSGLLTYDPARRLTAQEALQHPYFTESPLPQHPSMMPTFPSRAEGATRRKRTYDDYLSGKDVSSDVAAVSEGLLNDNICSSGAGFQLK